MKKESAAPFASDGLDKLVSKLSSFEAILIEVIVCLVIFISVLTPKVARASAPGTASLTASWSRPNLAYVTSTYTNGSNTKVQCASSSLSCTLGPFWGNPTTINYVVHDSTTTFPIQSGSKSTYLSGGLAYATISWTYKYEYQVYPNNLGGCDAAVLSCRKSTITSNDSTVNLPFSDLTANTNYRVIVCITSCLYYIQAGRATYKNYTEVTGIPASNLVIGNFSPTCNAYGLVNADFSWNRATGRSYDVQYVDYTTNVSSWPAVGKQAVFTADPNKLSVTDLFPNTTYYWRVNSRILGTTMWDTSFSAPFTVPACAIPAKITTTPAVLVNPPAMNCSGAAPVYVNFSWKAAGITGGSYDYAYLDYSVYNDNFVSAYKNASLSATSTTYGGSGFPAGVTFYWRVNYHVAGSNPAQWVPSTTASFVASCGSSAGGSSPTFRPNGNGSYTQWTNNVPSSSAHFQNVDEATSDEDASYISATADGLWDTYTHNPSGLTTGTLIQSVSVYVRAKYAAAGSNNIVAPALVSGGKQVWADKTITSSYANYMGTWTADPATGLPWTISGVDAAQIGVRKSYAGADVHVTQVWAVVNYIGGPSFAGASCVRYDVTMDGSVGNTDLQLIFSHYTAVVPYDAKYDLNNDGVVDINDLNTLRNSGYYAKRCVANNGAVNAVCSTFAAGNVLVTANATFNWNPANGETSYPIQWLDYDTVDHGLGGGWPVSNARSFSSGVATSGVISGLQRGTTYFWRINTQMPDGTWASSKSTTFTTPSCVPVPGGLTATATSPDKAPDGSMCATNPYSVAFTWTNPNGGTGWYLDVSTDSGFAPGAFSTRNIDGNTTLLTNGSNFNPVISFNPAKTYYWRIYNGYSWFAGNSFSLPSCAAPSGPINYYIRYGDASIGAADLAALKTRIKSTWPASVIDNICINNQTCLDYAISQSVAHGISPAFMLTVWEEEGAYGGVSSSDQFGMVYACSAHDTVSSINCFLNFSGANPLISPSNLVGSQHPYNPADPYNSYVAWMNFMCGTTNSNFCYNNPNFITNMPRIYDNIAGTGKRVVF